MFNGKTKLKFICCIGDPLNLAKKEKWKRFSFQRGNRLCYTPDWESRLIAVLKLHFEMNIRDCVVIRLAVHTIYIEPNFSDFKLNIYELINYINSA